MQNSNKDQYQRVMMEKISEENQMVKRLKSDIESKCYQICSSKISKDSKRKIIKEILNYITNNSEPWINISTEYKSSTL